MIEVRMPADSNEGTEASLGRWLKRAGETVSEHEPLVEISTDKVTLEVPSPASGVVVDLLKREGEAVLPGELLGHIRSGFGERDETGADADTGLAASSAMSSGRSATEASTQPSSLMFEEGLSPAVRRLLAEHDLDVRSIPKVGRGGRITLDDVAAYLANRKQHEEQSDAQTAGRQQTSISGRRVPHTPMRKSIANHMARSVQAAPHVTAVFEADLSQVLADRATRKQAAVDDDAPSVTAYLIHAAVKAIQRFPEVNSKWHDCYLEVFDEVNFGVGTAVGDGGLVVPVIRDAQTLSLVQLSQALKTLTQKARSGKLTQADMQDGTFTLSNHGVSGSLLAAPIILPHGQAAILGAGKMQKRVIVCETGGRELFRVRPMMYVTLTVDHRVLDGQQTNGFLAAFVAALENPVQT